MSVSGPPPTAVERQAARSLERLLPRLRDGFAQERGADPNGWAAFEARLGRHFGALFAPLVAVYGAEYDFFYHLEQTLILAARSWLDRAQDLRALDAAREADPAWFRSERMIGAVCYVDLFAGDLAGLRAKLPYIVSLNVTYLHLMPLFRSPEGNSDGGYAVSSYREVDPALGTMDELADLAAELRVQGISLVLDFVFNHTADDHAWAEAARADPDDPDAFYWLFPDRTLPDAYGRTLRDIFPDQRPGSFTWNVETGRWVWTTFNSFQWDLRYASPAVFHAMAGEMLLLANRGVEILRLDAVAFVWKRLGTDCENLPEAHLLIRAFNALARIAAPALLFKSEAIVHPDEVARYIAPEECQLSYNPLLMALGWEALATRDARLLRDSLRRRFAIAPGCAWVNYVRSHDDIGWTFDDADAARLGTDGFDHRRFLNAFYVGRFDGSFARGLPFQENPRTGDARVCGTAASLAGLEKALREEGEAEVELAIGRVVALYGIALGIGGIPLLYLGDEVGTRNDYSFQLDPDKATDSRWVHRPFTDWAAVARAEDAATLEGRICHALAHLIELRRTNPVFGDAPTEIIDPGNDRVFGFVRQGHEDGRRLLALVNLTEAEQTVEANRVRLAGLAYAFRDLITGERLTLDRDVVMGPYQTLWLIGDDHGGP